ncbi:MULTISPECIES: RNA polymerase sigma factor [Anaerotruncus]|uniref:RNA polymerase sigma factor n=1 Tax=Anaerotruncus TaxID=244127 RepID=UPI00083172FF|nr:MULTISPECIES: sigma-70 family RNA polymerase sigma factor [Anaerotruncus]RGX56598.1 sigma-70 family RNA polymerase sigma factor [Anaerotruncus sp. AF02-27]
MTNEKFKELVEENERLVFTICYQLVRDYHEAQNLAQDTFVSAFAHIDNVKEQNLRAWLARIATNKAKDYLKSAYNRRVSLSEDMSEIDMLRSESSPERLYISDEGEGAIRQTILNLKEPYHKVAVLFFLKEQTVDEISEQLDRPKKTVQTQLYRARQMLQKILKEETQI